MSKPDQLHAAIMNLPCKNAFWNDAAAQAYREGHRDARHAAVELVASLQPTEAGQAADQDDCQHEIIITWRIVETGEPAGLWSCAECSRKFVPQDASPTLASTKETEKKC